SGSPGVATLSETQRFDGMLPSMSSGERLDDGLSPDNFGIGRLFRQVRDAIVVANARTERIVLWNQTAERMFGYKEAEALQLPLHTLVPETLRNVHRTGIARYQETGGGNLIDAGHPVELKGVHKAGHEVPIELTLTKIPERTPEGDRFALAIIRDITDRKRAEEAALRHHDMERRRQQALELNDEIVQGLAVAKMALETGRQDQGLEAVAQTMRRAQKIVSQLLADISEDRPLEPGDLVRRDPAQVKDAEPREERGT
ncbi:MAG: PAS domain S-box protein, partial [Actinomycetota bacterium]